MDYKKFADTISAMTCIISIEKKPNGKYGEIRIVDGNKAYIDSIEKKSDDTPDMLTDKFIPNSLYERYLPKDLNFEFAVYKAAVLKEPVHTYIHPERYEFWLNIFFMPLESEDENTGYCSYTMTLSKEADSMNMTDLSQDTLATVLNTCIKLRNNDEFKPSMDEVIKDIRKVCEANHCIILLLDHTERKCSVLCEDMVEDVGLKLMTHWLENSDFYDIASTWENVINGSTGLIIQSEADMDLVREKSPVWYDSLKEAGVESLVIFPLRYNDELMGYIWATNFNTINTSKIKDVLELTTFFIASEIANFKLLKKLKVLGSKDMLTGVYNRNEMNNRVMALYSEETDNPKPIGVVFADLNGLKRVNDQAGHRAGDLMLKNAAMVLQNAFVDNEVYRAGGDEFLILIPDGNIEEIKGRVSLMKKLANNYDNVSFAVGYCVDEDSRNVRQAMKLADELMYKDKEEFYKLHPEKRRV